MVEKVLISNGWVELQEYKYGDITMKLNKITNSENGSPHANVIHLGTNEVKKIIEAHKLLKSKSEKK